MGKIRSFYYIYNDALDTCSHDSLDGYLLVDGEKLRITWENGTQEDVEITLKTTTPKEVAEFGGGWHGFKHKDHIAYSFIMRNGEHFFLGVHIDYDDNIQLERIEAPLGLKIDDMTTLNERLEKELHERV
jgi:hypothetical protein